MLRALVYDHSSSVDSIVVSCLCSVIRSRVRASLLHVRLAPCPFDQSLGYMEVFSRTPLEEDFASMLSTHIGTCVIFIGGLASCPETGSGRLELEHGNLTQHNTIRPQLSILITHRVSE